MKKSDLETIGRSQIFEGVSPEDVPAALEKLGAVTMRYGKGEVIRHDSDKIDFFGIVLEGTVQTSVPDGDSHQIITKFGPGSVFAEAVAMAIGRTVVQITALTEVRILMIKTAPFLSLASDPLISKLLVNMLLDMSGKLITLNTKIRILGKNRLRGKVSAFLMSLGPDEDGFVEIPLSRNEMASYMGVDRSALSRELGRMQDDGVISVDKRKVRILRRGIVENAAEGIYGMIDSTKTMREIVSEDPAFGEFLVHKGFPFSVNNPITEVVTFDDVVQMQAIDKDAFLAEYEEWRSTRQVSGLGV